MMDLVTGPMRYHTSVVAQSLLESIGLPVARQGVILAVGQYQLLVSEACSGMNSATTMAAAIATYLAFDRKATLSRGLLLLALSVPMAFMVNCLRVVLLALITYYFGDDAGQGFIHPLTGYVAFTVGLLALLCLARRAVNPTGNPAV